MKSGSLWLWIAVAFVIPQSGLAADTLSYSGSSTIGTGVLDSGAVEAFKARTGIRFESVEQPGSGKGIQALIDERVSVAGASRALKPKEKRRKLVGTIIGYDAIAVFVHEENPVDSLSKKQLKGIFTGEITNWQEVGGNDAPIRPNTEILGGKRATVEIFQKSVLDGAAYGKGFREIDFPRDQIAAVADDENGICSVSLGLLASVREDLRTRVKTVAVDGIAPSAANVQSGAYLISRPLLLVSRGLPKGEVKEFISFMLSAEGQSIVGRKFVQVRRR